MKKISGIIEKALIVVLALLLAVAAVYAVKQYTGKGKIQTKDPEEIVTPADDSEDESGKEEAGDESGQAEKGTADGEESQKAGDEDNTEAGEGDEASDQSEEDQGDNEESYDYSEVIKTATDTIEWNGKTYTKKTNVESILLIGIDKYDSQVSTGGYRNHYQADFLVLVVIDHNTGSTKAVQITRELMVPVSILGASGDEVGTKNQQICLAYNYGSGGSDSCINTCEAVSTMFKGINIDHYVRTTMDAVPIINDAVGGVTITIPSDLTGADPAWTEGAEITLTGEQALSYVRTRKYVGESTSTNRMSRQRQYLQALLPKINSLVSSDGSFSSSLVAQISSYINSDLSASSLASLAKQGVLANTGSFMLISGTNTKNESTGYIEYVPDEDSLMSVLLSLFYN